MRANRQRSTDTSEIKRDSSEPKDQSGDYLGSLKEAADRLRKRK
mgnify:CR=1 FL=1